MNLPGTDADPLRVAIVGSGPAGFYVAQALQKSADPVASIDMFDRLPTPFGLVRHGVAPDHQKIKSVIAVYHKAAVAPRFRFFGGVNYGSDLSLADLHNYYHQIVFCTGAQTDRRMGIPGEDLAGSHPATEFVAWYNGHPDFTDHRFDLSHERAIVVGVGNVAVDVARILCRSPAELATTDIADHALAALRESRVREVYLLGRRGPAQAAFTNPEVKELGELADASACTLPEECEPDALSAPLLESDRTVARKVDILKSFAGRSEPGKAKRLVIRFLVSPVAILGDDRGHVRGVELVRNELFRDEGGTIRSRATDRQETLEAGLVFRSVGYRGVPLPDLPFDERRGVIPNERGRVLDPDAGGGPGVYVSGWIKRGPTGVIGTNKPDAVETVKGMLEDLEQGRLNRAEGGQGDIGGLLESRGVRYLSYGDWEKIDALEVERGRPLDRPRVKFTRQQEFLDALGG